LLADKENFLFDLDGTLLNINMEEFIKYYFDALSREFSDLCESREEFIKILMNSTEEMIKNNGKKTNQEVFMEDFFQKINISKNQSAEKIKKRFDNFYDSKFPKLKKYFQFDKELPLEIIGHLKAKEKKIVLATNPLFPREAVVERLNWAGLSEDDFDFITSYENMSYAKPNPKYYQQILDKIDEKPEDCVMIGNDMAEDTPAFDVGIATIIIHDHIIEAENGEEKIRWKGSLKDFVDILKETV